MPALAKLSRSRFPSHSVKAVVHTAGHRKCPACELLRKKMLAPKAFADLTFPAAAELWLEARRRRLAPASVKDYSDCILRLTNFFAALPLSEIHIGHFEQYQTGRKDGSGGLSKAGPSRINHELNTLSQILERANLWASIAPYYQPLHLPRPKAGCALTEAEERRLFDVAGSKSRWKVAYLCSLITANTTAGPGEIRMLRLMDVDLTPQPPGAPFGLIKVELGAKNDYRVRPLPLNLTAHMAARALLDRAAELGAVRPDHFLLPHRAEHGNGKRKGDWDPSRPMSSWRKAWSKLRAAAGLPRLRMYDLRHHVITRLLENEQVSERTVIELAGHVSKKMLERYSHIRMRTKLEGVLALEGHLQLQDSEPPLVTPKKLPAPAGLPDLERRPLLPGT